MRIVRPTEVWTLRPRRVETLVLTACHPPRSDALRLVVFAQPAALVPPAPGDVTVLLTRP